MGERDMRAGKSAAGESQSGVGANRRVSGEPLTNEEGMTGLQLGQACGVTSYSAGTLASAPYLNSVCKTLVRLSGDLYLSHHASKCVSALVRMCKPCVMSLITYGSLGFMPGPFTSTESTLGKSKDAISTASAKGVSTHSLLHVLT